MTIISARPLLRYLAGSPQTFSRALKRSCRKSLFQNPAVSVRTYASVSNWLEFLQALWFEIYLRNRKSNAPLRFE